MMSDWVLLELVKPELRPYLKPKSTCGKYTTTEELNKLVDRDQGLFYRRVIEEAMSNRIGFGSVAKGSDDEVDKEHNPLSKFGRDDKYGS